MIIQNLVKGLIGLIGGYQVLVIGFLPLVSKRLENNLFYTLLIFACSIGLYLLFTKIWELYLGYIKPK